MSQQFPSPDPVMQGRRSNIGPFGMASLAISLAAGLISLCFTGAVATALGALAMLAGFVCFYMNREYGSRRDLVIGIGGMLLGFLVFTSSIYRERAALPDANNQEQQSRPSEATSAGNPGYQAPERDPFATPKNLPEPTRPATQNRGGE